MPEARGHRRQHHPDGGRRRRRQRADADQPPDAAPHRLLQRRARKNDSACGGNERFYGAGEERLKMSFPDGYGYQIDTADTWYAVYMYMNHRAADRHRLDQVLVHGRSGSADPLHALLLAGRRQLRLRPDLQRAGHRSAPASPTAPSCARRRRRRARRARAARPRNCEKKAKSIRAAMPTEASNVVSKDVKFEARRLHRHRRRPRPRWRQGAEPDEAACPGNPEVAESIPTWGNPDHPFYNVKPILHEPGPVGMSAFRAPDADPGRATLGDPDQQRPDAAAELGLRRPAAAHAGDGHLRRLRASGQGRRPADR